MSVTGHHAPGASHFDGGDTKIALLYSQNRELLPCIGNCRDALCSQHMKRGWGSLAVESSKTIQTIPSLDFFFQNGVWIGIGISFARIQVMYSSTRPAVGRDSEEMVRRESRESGSHIRHVVRFRFVVLQNRRTHVACTAFNICVIHIWIQTYYFDQCIYIYIDIHCISVNVMNR